MFLAILSCNYGGGHQRVAEVIAAEWRAQTGGRVEIVDYFTRFANPRFDSLTRFWYYQTIRFAPGVQRRFYDFMGEIRPDSWFRRQVNRTGMERLHDYLTAERPDAVCCVHWTFTGTMSDLKGAGRTAVPCLTVITDYVAHGEWIHPNVERYCVPHEVMRDGLCRRGVPAGHVLASGVPVERKFDRQQDRAALMKRFGLTPGVPVVLVMAGAYAALGRVDDLVQVLARVPRPIQPLVVCANAPRLARRVRAAGGRSAHPFRVFGYVDNIDELMTVSDLLVTKAGGVTVSEAFMKGLPMLVFGSIPGQEESNTDFVVGQGAAVAVKTPAEASEALDALLARPDRLAELARAAARLRRPDAARIVVAELARLAAGSGAHPVDTPAVASPA